MKTKTEIKNGWWLQFKKMLAMRAGVLSLVLAAASSQAQTYTILHSFGSGGSRAGLILSGTHLYGTTADSGAYGYGTVFKLNTDGSGFTTLHNFVNYWCGDYWSGDGANPDAPLVLSGATLYGTTWEGGISNCGTVFEVNTDGSAYSVLRSFNGGSDGIWPCGNLAFSGTTLYGMTSAGGFSYGYGTIFKVNTDASGYAELLSCCNGNALMEPFGGLLLDGTTLYGTTFQGGSYGHGAVFRINIDGSGCTVLKSFTPPATLTGTNADGAGPWGSLVLSGTTLYGTTARGGINAGGTVFEVGTDGSGFAVLKQLDNNSGGGPEGGLVLSGTTLYGTTQCWGASGNGTVFQVNTDGSGFAVLKNFTGSDGIYPEGSLIVSGTTLYGTTAAGVGGGKVFSLSIAPPNLLTSPQTQTAEVGNMVNLAVHTTGDPVLAYQWFFNGNTITVCTNHVLCLSDVQASNAGTYTVVVTNLFGAVTSAPAMLNVITPVERTLVPGVNLMGQAGNVLGLDYTDILGPAADWETMATITLSNSSQFCFDLTTPLPPQRFYRAWQTGTPNVVPSLSLPGMVPVITLTGNVGDSLQLDYINTIGPTNAWVMLDMIDADQHVAALFRCLCPWPAASALSNYATTLRRL